MSSILHLALKDLRLLWRDRVGLFWVFALPLLMALFFGSILSTGDSGKAKMTIAAVDESGSPNAEAFFANLESSSALSVRRLPRDSAEMLVAKGGLVAYVALRDAASISGKLFHIDMPAIEVGIDPARKAEAGYLQGLVSQAYYTILQEQMTDPSRMQTWTQEGLAGLDSAAELSGHESSLLQNLVGSLGDLAAAFGSADINMVEITVNRDRPRTAYEISFPQALMWGLIAVAATFALSIVGERRRGTYLRLRVAPIGRAHILAGKGLACFAVCMSVSVYLLALGNVLLGVRIVNPAGLVMAVVACGACFTGIMMLVSVLGKTERAVSGGSWGILLVASMLGGGMVPLIAMPSWMLTVSHLSPVKWGILSLEGAIWRGFTTADMMLPVGILLAIGAAAFATGVTILARYDG